LGRKSLTPGVSRQNDLSCPNLVSP
jgi:hypothetical protein